MKHWHCALQSPAELKQSERHSESTANYREIPCHHRNTGCTRGIMAVVFGSKGLSGCVKHIDSAADEHMGVRRRQFHGIYMADEGKLRLCEDNSVVLDLTAVCSHWFKA